MKKYPNLLKINTKHIEKEVIFKEDLEEIFGKRAWEPEEKENRPIENEPEETIEDTKDIS